MVDKNNRDGIVYLSGGAVPPETKDEKMEPLNFKVIEDNGGGMHLYVFGRQGNCVYAHTHFEFGYKTDLKQCIAALNDNPKAYTQWDGCEDDCAAAWASVDENESAWANNGYLLVYTQDGPVNTDKWGNAATDLLG